MFLPVSLLLDHQELQDSLNLIFLQVSKRLVSQPLAFLSPMFQLRSHQLLEFKGKLELLVYLNRMFQLEFLLVLLNLMELLVN